jgi:DNA-binding LytR/AlgR family response regulator
MLTLAMPARIPISAGPPPAISAQAGDPATEPGGSGREPVPVLIERSEMAGGDPAGFAGGAGGEAPRGIDDRGVRAIGIPAFGIGIPRITGLLDDVGPAGPHAAGYWIGSLAFVALAAAIWHGNRWLLFEQRRHWDWFEHPVRKVVMLLAAIVLFTVPLTVATLAAWYAARGAPADVAAIRTVVLMIVICVVFVTHVYETVFLIKERASDRVRVAELERARAEAQLSAFLAQADPHFMFNALHALAALVETDAPRARAFTLHLAEMHRYLLAQLGKTLATVGDELRFMGDFAELMRLRLGAGLTITRDARRFAVDQTLAELEAELGAEFFRVNRQYLVCAAAVAGFRPHARGKLRVELAPPPPGEVIVSQDNAARFRAWLAG